MKKYISHFLILTLAVAAVSCMEKENQGQPEAKMKGMYYAKAITEEPVIEISPGKTKTISVLALADTLKGSVSDIKLTLSFKADMDAVSAYNSANGTSYSACPGSAYEFISNEVMMPRYGVSSTSAKLKLSTSGLEDGITYLIPIVVDKVTETDNWELSPTPYAYVVVKRAYVAPSAGTGKENDPYNIYTAADLVSMSDRLEDNVKVYFRLQADIDMTEVKWVPLNFASPYTYAIDFDGNGHTIANFSCDFANYPSFFGVLNGVCHDVTFTNASLENQGTNACGILGAYCRTTGLPGICRNVHVEGVVESVAGDRGVGGLFGRVHYGTVTDSSFKGKVIGSVYGAGPEDFSKLAAKMEDYGACAVELNLSCPHAKGYGMEVGTDPAMVKSIVSAVTSSVSIPVWAKLTPNTHILTQIGMAVQDAGGDAVVAINTLKAMVISPEFARPIMSNKFCGLSGEAVKPVGVRAIYDLKSVLDIPLVGVGGISDWRDAAEYIMAGACAFQVGSAVGTKGLCVFKEINEGLSAFMEEYGYSSIGSMVGAAHE